MKKEALKTEVDIPKVSSEDGHFSLEILITHGVTVVV